MSEKQWYEDIPIEDFAGKHVRAVVDGGAVIEGRLAVWEDRQTSIYMGSLSDDGLSPLRTTIDGRRELMYGITRLDLVWDERDWQRTSLDDIEAIDALVVAGRLYELVSHKPDCDLWQVRIPGEKHTARVATAMISCALRRKVGAAEEHESSGPFESLVQYLMPKIPVSDGRAA